MTLTPIRDRRLDRRSRSGHGERPTDKSEGCCRAVREKLKELHEAYGEAMLENKSLKKAAPPSRPGKGLIRVIHAEMAEEGTPVSIEKLCRWFGLSRRTYYYKPVKSAPKVNETLAGQIGGLIEEMPTAGYRTAACGR